MTLIEAATTFGAVIAWDAIWVQVFVIPFINKREDLQKDYDQSGMLDATLSFIETTQVIPALARMFFRVCQGQEDRKHKLTDDDELQQILSRSESIEPDYLKHAVEVAYAKGQEERRRRFTEPELRQLLNQVGYADDLKSATDAMQQAHSVQAMFSKLQEYSDRIWKWALLHAIAVLAVPACYLLAGQDRIFVFAGAIVVAVIPFLMALATVWGFLAVRREFLTSVRMKRDTADG